MLEFRSRELTLVRRLRIAGAGLEPVTSRLRAERSFAALDLPALGLSPSAVLCIRALADPRPRSCRFAADGLRLTHAWRDSLRSEIERKARGASRPAREAVTASAECVLFADASELLSAAAEDWLAGRAHARWWWKSLLGAAAAGGRALPGLWLREREYVPGALEHLAAKGKAAEFARRLPDVEARAILRGLTAAFGWREPEAAVARDDDAAAASGSEFVDDDPDTRPSAGFELKPPWHGLVPECAGAGLDAAGEMLLGVGLSLSRAPALARRQDFARRAAAWARHAAEVGPRPDSNASRSRAARVQPSAPPASTEFLSEGEARKSDQPRGSTPPAPGARDESAERLSPRPTDGDAPNKYARAAEDGAEHRRRRAGGDEEREGDDGERASDASARAAKTGEDEGRDTAPASAIDGRANANDPRDTQLDATRGAADEPWAEPSPPPAARPAPLLEAEIETRFGGLFHLVNLGLFLNLYGDFTTPAEPGLPLPLWDFVALLGRRLAGARVERDAVWPLLARLAGRAAEDEPGLHFSPPDEWRAPAGWLAPFGAACVLRWSDAAGRLRVAHPAGFILIDAPRDLAPDEPSGVSPDAPRDVSLDAPPDASPDAPPDVPATPAMPADADDQIARELRPYVETGARFELRRVARVRGPRGRTSRARWLDHLSAYAVARLSLALGARGAARLSTMLCERHARVFVTAAHVDVVMRLGELPVEIRYAGLDRDPGWVPAAGRHVAFHFE
jgi:hypothetical protein